MSRGPWSQLEGVTNCPCSDGKRRNVRITGTADTFFSCPGRVHVKGKTVTGFVTNAPDYEEGVKAGYIFQPNLYGKNGAVLPAWTDDAHKAF